MEGKCTATLKKKTTMDEDDDVLKKLKRQNSTGSGIEEIKKVPFVIQCGYNDVFKM